MTWWQWMKDNTALAGVVTSSIFAFVTVCVILWQVLVMMWQGRNTDRHEREQNRLIKTQNKLIRFQFEYAWLKELNGERQELLDLVRKLRANVRVVVRAASGTEQQWWETVRDTVAELKTRLNVLNLAVYSGPYDSWYVPLAKYVNAVFDAAGDETNLQRPSDVTKERLRDANKICDDTDIFTQLEHAIESEYSAAALRWSEAAST